MKKTIALVVAVALIMSLAISAYAAELRAPESSGCDHVWGTATEYPVWEYVSDTQCRLKIVHIKTCTKCAEVSQTVISAIGYDHDETIFSATCDGTMQTHTYRCKKCNGYLPPKYVPCIGAGKNHANGCLWLPI